MSPEQQRRDYSKTPVEAAAHAAYIIRQEVERQNVMWGDINDRADIAHGQLADAALAQMLRLHERRRGVTTAFDRPPGCYPADWSGFRDYGSDIANLAVAAAFIQNEIKRLLRDGADTTRTSRDAKTQPYGNDQPKVQL